jgi:hypothetical protein
MAEYYMNLLKQSGFAMNRIVAGIIFMGTLHASAQSYVSTTQTTLQTTAGQLQLPDAVPGGGSYIAAAALNGAGQVFAPIQTTTAFTISSGTSPLAASTTYIWGYRCDQ